MILRELLCCCFSHTSFGDLKAYEKLRKFEGDVQDIFINKIEINNNELTIWNEVNDKFIVDIETKEIIPKNKVYKN